MRYILANLILIFVCNVAKANVCGPEGSIKKHIVPDSICVDAQGNCITSKNCDSKQSNGLVRQKADFTEACGLHDACYSTVGNSKKDCDVDFYKNLKKACRDDIKGSDKALRACVNVANDYVDVVRGQLYKPVACGFKVVSSKLIGDGTGCKAYIEAQKRAGVTNPSCDQKTSLEPQAEDPNSMIQVDWPTDLEVTCESKKPAFTDIVISVKGLEEKKGYTLKLEGYNSGGRYISPRRTGDPKILFKDAYAGLYEAKVWYAKASIAHEKLITSKSFVITRPNPILATPEKIAANTPFNVRLSNVIAPLKRGSIYLTVAPKHYPFSEYEERKSGIENCKPVEHTFKGLPNGQYIIRLFQTSYGGGILFASEEISVAD